MARKIQFREWQAFWSSRGLLDDRMGWIHERERELFEKHGVGGKGFGSSKPFRLRAQQEAMLEFPVRRGRDGVLEEGSEFVLEKRAFDPAADFRGLALAAVGREAGQREIVQWVMRNAEFSVSEIDPASVPDPTAAFYLRLVKGGDSSALEFLRSIGRSALVDDEEESLSRRKDVSRAAQSEISALLSEIELAAAVHSEGSEVE